jgi:hypothetical protein
MGHGGSSIGKAAVLPLRVPGGGQRKRQDLAPMTARQPQSRIYRFTSAA